MIWTIFRLGWLHLKRDRVALLLTFALPIVFFSIFAAVFSDLDTDHLEKLEAVLVLEDEGETGERLATLLEQEPALLIHRLETGEGRALREVAAEQVQERQVDVGIVVPSGFADRLSDSSSEARPVQVLADSSNPLVGELAAGILNAVTVRLTFEQLGMIDESSGGEALESPFSFEIADVVGDDDDKSAVAFFSAGIGVMFLLFAVSGRSGILIDEKESGVLRRVLASRLGLGQLLIGHWLFLAALGFAQVSVMFVWGWAAFGLDLWTAEHLTGFVIMTAVSAAAAAAFGLFLASLCRTRIQLAGVSAVVILVMSALGGSMFPRYLMPEGLKKLGLLTFNAWALDGYQKVFWYETGLADLKPQVLVLVAVTLVFLLATRMLASRLVRDS
ncbi:MAG: ABC transporter permease [Thermoanaerobaculia bacterium]